MQLYLFRHGETEWNVEKRIQGQTDTALNKNGIRQAEAIRPLIDKLDLQIVYSSDLSRSYDTAKIALKGKDIQIETMKGLRERSLGKLVGMTIPEAQEKYNISEDIHFLKDGVNHIVEEHPELGVETMEEWCFRAIETMEEIVKKAEGKEKIGISTHGGFIFSFLKCLGHSEFVKNAEIVDVEYKNGKFVFKEIIKQENNPTITSIKGLSI